LVDSLERGSHPLDATTRCTHYRGSAEGDRVIEYAFFPCIFIAIGVGFWLGLKCAVYAKKDDDDELRREYEESSESAPTGERA
jgi:hypothetical protein